MVVPPNMRIRPVGNYSLWGDFGRGHKVCTGAVRRIVHANGLLAINNNYRPIFSSDENVKSVVISTFVFFFFPFQSAAGSRFAGARFRDDSDDDVVHAPTAVVNMANDRATLLRRSPNASTADFANHRRTRRVRGGPHTGDFANPRCH